IELGRYLQSIPANKKLIVNDICSFLFFFSSRRRHTRCLSDWSSDVCSSDLSGKGQKIARCPVCRVALWSTYAGAGDALRFVRVGTLDDPDCLQPDIHIYTESKQPWVVIPAGARAVSQYYRRSEVWSAERLARRERLVGL